MIKANYNALKKIRLIFKQSTGFQYEANMKMCREVICIKKVFAVNSEKNPQWATMCFWKIAFFHFSAAVTPGGEKKNPALK